MVLVGTVQRDKTPSARDGASREHGRRIHRLVRHVRARLEGRLQGAGRDLDRDRRRDLAGAVAAPAQPAAAPRAAQPGSRDVGRIGDARHDRSRRRTTSISAAATSSRSAARPVCAARSTTSSRRRRKTRCSRARTPASPTSYALLPLYANVRVDSLMPLAHDGDQPRDRARQHAGRSVRVARDAAAGGLALGRRRARLPARAHARSELSRRRTSGTASCCCSTDARPTRRRSSSARRELDPLSPITLRFVRARRSRSARRRTRRDRRGRAPSSSTPTLVVTRFMLGTVYLQAGRMPDAMRELETATRLDSSIDRRRSAC